MGISECLSSARCHRWLMIIKKRANNHDHQNDKSTDDHDDQNDDNDGDDDYVDDKPSTFPHLATLLERTKIREYGPP